MRGGAVPALEPPATHLHRGGIVNQTLQLPICTDRGHRGHLCGDIEDTCTVDLAVRELGRCLGGSFR